MFRRIALAVAFSPRTEALLAEASRLCGAWQAHLTLIHVGVLDTGKMIWLKDTLGRLSIAEQSFDVHAESGDPSKVILRACRDRRIDLLIAGALQKENLVKYYLGTVGRNILRNAPCSVLMLTHPRIEDHAFGHIVALAEDTPHIKETLRAACSIATASRSAWLHILREIKMYGLTLAATGQSTEEEYSHLRHQLVREEIEAAEGLITDLPHEGVKVNIKVVSGKAGYEVSRFAERKHADLIVVGAPERRFNFLDRFFSNDLEYLFADLPCNFMMVQPLRSDR